MLLHYDGYLGDLNKLAELLTERRRQRFDDRHVDYLLVAASELACVSLSRLLAEDQFWSWLDHAPNSRPESIPFDRVVVIMADAELLRQLGYKTAEPGGDSR